MEPGPRQGRRRRRLQRGTPPPGSRRMRAGRRSRRRASVPRLFRHWSSVTNRPRGPSTKAETNASTSTPVGPSRREGYLVDFTGTGEMVVARAGRGVGLKRPGGRRAALQPFCASAHRPSVARERCGRSGDQTAHQRPGDLALLRALVARGRKTIAGRSVGAGSGAPGTRTTTTTS